MAKILFVDDYYETREIYSELLKKAGHDVIVSGDGEDALKKIIDEGYDLILLDLLLPKKNAIDILKELKEKNIKADKKIVVMSVVGQESLVDEAKKLGAIGNISKSSLSQEEVLNNIVSFL